MNENHLLEAMGLTRPTEDEVASIFSPELTSFLKSQRFVQGLESASNSPPKEDPLSFPSNNVKKNIPQLERNEKASFKGETKKFEIQLLGSSRSLQSGQE
jgi:hypothetical protein